jgi:hypothetical protein
MPTTGTFRLRIDGEVLICTARSGTNLTVTRGVEGSIADSHADGTGVDTVFTAGALNQLKADIEADSRFSNDRVSSGLRTAESIVAVSSSSAPITGQVLTAIDSAHAGWGGSISVGGSVTNFDNGHTTSDVALSSNSSTSVLPVTLSGLVASKKYNFTLGIRVVEYTDSNHAVAGSIDLVVDCNATTDSSGVATCTLAGTPSPDTSRLPAGLSGATATVAASTGGFTIFATRPTGTACHVRAHWWVNTFEDVT